MSEQLWGSLPAAHINYGGQAKTNHALKRFMLVPAEQNKQWRMCQS
jgi:hypothetical protein